MANGIVPVRLWIIFYMWSLSQVMWEGVFFSLTGWQFLTWFTFTGHRWIALTKASDAELWCFFLSAPWINNREAGDLRRHLAHYDVIVMRHGRSTIVVSSNSTSECTLRIRIRPNIISKHFNYKLINCWRNGYWLYGSLLPISTERLTIYSCPKFIFSYLCIICVQNNLIFSVAHKMLWHLR